MRFNFFGGAGSGKSTTAAWAFSFLKERGHNTELVLEYIKTWAYLERGVKSFDQVHIMSQQLHSEDFLIYSGVKNIVSDCPILLSPIYSYYYRNSSAISEPLRMIANHFSNVFPETNIFLKRNEKEYQTHGRYQSLEEAKKIDDYILEFLIKNRTKNLWIIDWDDRKTLSEILIKNAD
jgi:hypothetical protein